MMQRCSIHPPSMAPLASRVDRSLGHGLAALALAIALAGGADAQTTRPQLPPAAPPSDHLLAGPRVQEQPESGPGPRFDGPRRGRRPALPVNRWLAVYRSLDLDQDQRARARLIVSELQKARRAFQREHGPEERRLQELVRTARRDGLQALDPDDRRRLQELRQRQPRVEATMLRLWRLLTPRQQDLMRERLRAGEGRAPVPRRTSTSRAEWSSAV